jgi:SHS2 domain-containing protein
VTDGDASRNRARDRVGHLSYPDRTGNIIEAWAPDAATCLTEALSALVQGFADVSDSPTARLLPLSVANGPEDALTALVEEVLDTIDAFSVVPVRFHLSGTEDGGFAGDMEVVPVRDVEWTHPCPTAVSFEGLSMKTDGTRWSCHVRVE